MGATRPSALGARSGGDLVSPRLWDAPSEQTTPPAPAGKDRSGDEVRAGARPPRALGWSAPRGPGAPRALGRVDHRDRRAPRGTHGAAAPTRAHGLSSGRRRPRLTLRPAGRAPHFRGRKGKCASGRNPPPQHFHASRKFLCGFSRRRNREDANLRPVQLKTLPACGLPGRGPGPGQGLSPSACSPRGRGRPGTSTGPQGACTGRSEPPSCSEMSPTLTRRAGARPHVTDVPSTRGAPGLKCPEPPRPTRQAEGPRTPAVRH